jgi:hypothetical protein
MRLLFTLFLAFSMISSKAQTNITTSSVKYGIKAGINVSNMNFNKGVPAPPNTINASWKPGFLAGLLMQVPLTGKFYIQPEYLYLQSNGENTNTRLKYNMTFVSLPVLFKYEAIPNLFLTAGPQFDLLIKATEDDQGKKTDITHDTEERSIFAVGGVEFSPFTKLNIGARYLHGFNHIGLGQRSAVTEFKYETAQLSLAYTF